MIVYGKINGKRLRIELDRYREDIRRHYETNQEETEDA